MQMKVGVALCGALVLFGTEAGADARGKSICGVPSDERVLYALNVRNEEPSFWAHVGDNWTGAGPVYAQSEATDPDWTPQQSPESTPRGTTSGVSKRHDGCVSRGVTFGNPRLDGDTDAGDARREATSKTRGGIEYIRETIASRPYQELASVSQIQCKTLNRVSGTVRGLVICFSDIKIQQIPRNGREFYAVEANAGQVVGSLPGTSAGTCDTTLDATIRAHFGE